MRCLSVCNCLTGYDCVYYGSVLFCTQCCLIKYRWLTRIMWPPSEGSVMSTVSDKYSTNFNRFADEKLLLRKRQNEQLYVYLFVAGALVVCWLLGLYQFSFVWVFAVIFLTFVMWKIRLLSVTEYFLRQCELRMHQRRALSQSETAEWLNFVIRRWYARA